MSTVTEENSADKPICDIPLCGLPAEWKVDMFGKAEYYCRRHKSNVPETFMTKIT